MLQKIRFGTDGWRGVIAEDYTFDNVRRCAQGFADYLKATYPDITDKVKAFAVSDRIPNDGMQFIKSLDPKLQAVIVEGMLAMAQDPGGKAVLKSLYNYNALQQVEPNFYNDFAAVLKKAGVDPTTLVK